jgi:hypothetical protein
MAWVDVISRTPRRVPDRADRLRGAAFIFPKDLMALKIIPDCFGVATGNPRGCWTGDAGTGATRPIGSL